MQGPPCFWKCRERSRQMLRVMSVMAVEKETTARPVMVTKENTNAATVSMNTAMGGTRLRI